LGDNKMPVAHRLSPCPPLKSAGPSSPLTLTDVLRRDTYRVRSHFAARSGTYDAAAASGGATISTNGTSGPYEPGTQDYTVVVCFGTPGQQLAVGLDISSFGMSALRCKPCVSGATKYCDPAFDSSRSTTFTHVPCGSPDCPTKCTGSVCSYPDRPYQAIDGAVAQDVLTLAPSATVNDFTFICMDQAQTTGWLDLSRGSHSLASRLSSPGPPAFSYYLPQSTSSRGFLSVGTKRLERPDGDHATHAPLMYNHVDPDRYFIELIGMSLGGKDLPIPPAAFDPNSTTLDGRLSISCSAMASHGTTLVRLLVLCLLCSASLAATQRYLSVSMDELLSSKAHVDCPPLKKSVTTSGNKLTIPASCGCIAPICPGAGESIGRHVLRHDINRLSTLLQRSSVSSAAPAPSSAIPLPPGTPFPFPFPPAPAPSARHWFPFPFPPAPAPSARHGIQFPFPFPPAPAPSARPGTPFPFPFPPAPSAVPGIPISSPAEAPAVTIPDSSGTYLETLEFVVTVGFGTPARAYTVVFDTGSDVSWIQCQPCSGHCYKQHDPIFDPTKSSTYAAVPCRNQECKAAGGKCDSNGTCLYEVEYGDQSSTSGVLSHETLSLTNSSALHGFVFGCGQNNQGTFGDVDGLIGLGRSKLSLSSQAAASLGATFSYCLPSHNNTEGYLTIGATPVSDKVQYTAMIQKPEYSSFYFVELVSINIGGYILPVPPTVFTSAGTLLDSGTILTYLPTEAYTALRDRFKFTMTQYTPAPAQDILDTCYNFTGQSAIFIPAVSFKFIDGAVFDLDFFGIMIFPDDATAIGCLAFAARPATMPFNIVGNTQQRSAEVIYDVAAEKIGFVPGSC
ncbi:Aspartyl protease family protein, partial [Dichanthelium oligosanthes]